jgi:hypothetical protein
MEYFFVFIAWLVLCGAAAAYASNNGRSGAGVFFLSLFLSPLVGFLVAVSMEPHQQKVAAARGMKKCPHCSQFIAPDASTCPFCQKDLNPQISQFSIGEFKADALSKKCPDCAESIKLEALVCRFCGRRFQPAEVQAAIQKAKAEFEERVILPQMKDKLIRGLCPNCDAYNAWTDDIPKNIRTCDVCGKQYPFSECFS